jgi:hypothetical protein
VWGIFFTQKHKKEENIYQPFTNTKRFSCRLRLSRQPCVVVLSAEEIRQIVIMTTDWHYPVMTVANMFHVFPERVYQLRNFSRSFTP